MSAASTNVHVAFLKGMNLGGRRLTNERLKAEFEALGLERVATFRASGNVVFAAPRESEAKLQARIESALAERLGYEVATFLRPAHELAELAGAAPFTEAELAASKGKAQVMLLASEPDAAARRHALELAPKADRLQWQGRALHWLPATGLADAELDMKALQKLTGPVTVRTKGTIEQIAAKYCAPEDGT